MMRNSALILATCSLLIPALQAQGQTEPQGQTAAAKPVLERMSSREFRGLTVPGKKVEENVKRLTKEMRWYSSLGSALAAGRSQGKPVLWVHALGDLKGFL
jgi:hypothetical protein